jgi:hypothetical protein
MLEVEKPERKDSLKNKPGEGMDVDNIQNPLSLDFNLNINQHQNMQQQNLNIQNGQLLNDLNVVSSYMLSQIINGLKNNPHNTGQTDNK